MDARHVTVGMAAENTWVARRDGSDRALLIDPGDEPERIQALIADMGVTVEAILITHCHFDHVGAVTPLARATGAPVYCPKLEVPVLADIMRWVPWPGIGPFESYDADETVEGGERLQLAGFDIDVIFTPGHSPGHVTYSIPDEQAVFSGDVLFEGSVGRVDLPGGDWGTLLRSIGELVDDAAGRDARAARPHGRDLARRRAPDEPVPPRTAGVSEQDPGSARHVRRAGRRRARPRPPRRDRARASSSRPATRGSRRRRSSPRRCSRAAWASPPTSCRRRCTRSTRATSRSR